MDAFDTLIGLSSFMGLEPGEEFDCPALIDNRPIKATKILPDRLHVGSAQLPGGKRVRLLKTLLTSACERNCYYCPFRAGRNFQRLNLKPEEMAKAFIYLYRAGVVDGIFLSSGIVNGSICTQDKLLDTANILRTKYSFQGYIHLKLMPGVEKEQVFQAMRMADRISVNLEAPNSLRLEMLAPRKQFIDELLLPMWHAQNIRKSLPSHLGWKGRWPSLVTQFVVGAVGESDFDLLSTTEHLHNTIHLSRAYFSAFSPINDTPFENLPAASPKRELRLYQASYLIRDYGFNINDLAFLDNGHLPLDKDPKLMWAEANLADQPIEINKADPATLLRIPGIGPKGVNMIINARKQGTLTNFEQLWKLGINSIRAAPFILLNGKQPIRQLSLW